jgi:hypothetical protein
VKPYVHGNKTDRADAAGILEADRCGQIASVAIKTPEQQGVQAQHRGETRGRNQDTHRSDFPDSGASGSPTYRLQGSPRH